MPNNIDGTTNKLQISSTNSSIAKLIDYDKEIRNGNYRIFRARKWYF